MPIYKQMHRIMDLKKQTALLITLIGFHGMSVCSAAASTPPPPSVGSIPNVVATVVNMLLAASIAVLIIIIAYGIIKAALASGDPRGIEGAKSTWTYAIYGFFIVFFSFVIYKIIVSILGLSGSGFQRESMFNIIIEPLQELINVGQSNSSPTP